MITKEQYECFVAIRNTGEINMFDLQGVIEMSNDVLDKEAVLYIYENWNKLQEEDEDYTEDDEGK
jgi:hypothetical protein